MNVSTVDDYAWAIEPAAVTAAQQATLDQLAYTLIRTLGDLLNQYRQPIVNPLSCRNGWILVTSIAYDLQSNQMVDIYFQYRARLIRAEIDKARERLAVLNPSRSEKRIAKQLCDRMEQIYKANNKLGELKDSLMFIEPLKKVEFCGQLKKSDICMVHALSLIENLSDKSIFESSRRSECALL